MTQKIDKEDIKEDNYNIDEILSGQSNSNLTSEQISYTTEKLSYRVNKFHNSEQKLSFQSNNNKKNFERKKKHLLN